MTVYKKVLKDISNNTEKDNILENELHLRHYVKKSATAHLKPMFISP